MSYKALPWDGLRGESMQVNYKVVGDRGLLVEFENKICPKISGQVRALMERLEEGGTYKALAIEEVIPSYRSILILYDPMQISFDVIKLRIQDLVLKAMVREEGPRKILQIPTLYGGQMGPDLEYVAKYNGLSTKDLIEIHSKTDYLIYMLGFTLGFTYLGGLDPRIGSPRLESPRLRIPAGSVGIADLQTGIYPIDSPGGWQIIGRTPIPMMDLDRDPPVLARAGMYIRFRPIQPDEYRSIEESVKLGTYRAELI